MSIPIFILEKQLCSQCQKYLTVGPVKVYLNRQVRCGRCVKENDNGVESKLFSTVMKGMVFPCINSLEGCAEEYSIQEMKNHEKDCLEHVFSCPICEKFEGSSYALNRHCKTFHKNEELKVKAFPINLNQGNSQRVYFYRKSKMILFISYSYEVDLNNIKINISFPGDKYNGDVLQSVSLYTIDHQLKYRTQIKPCSKLNSTESDGFTIDMSQLNFTKNIVLCEFDIIEKSILSLVENQFLIDPVLDNFKARCNFDNISKIVEKIYFPAVYYFSDIAWKVFIDVVDNHVEVGLCWEKTNNTTILDLYSADINLTLLSSKKHLSRKVEQIKLESFNVLKFKLGTIFNLASRNEIIQNDSINIEVKVNIYLYTKTETKTNEKPENSCAHCGCNCVSQDIKKSPGNDSKWCKVDDEVDSRCTTMKAIEHHNGGHEEDIAYTLAYVKDQELYMTIQVLLEDQFKEHQGDDLYDPENAQFQIFEISKVATLAEMMKILADHFKYPLEQIRPWPFSHRPNQTIRPHWLDLEPDGHKSVIDAAENVNPWKIFLELLTPNSDTFDEETHVMLFFKMYDPKQKKIHYCGHSYVSCDSTLHDIVPLLNERAGFAPDTGLLLYREIGPNIIEELTNLNRNIRVSIVFPCYFCTPVMKEEIEMLSERFYQKIDAYYLDRNKKKTLGQELKEIFSELMDGDIVIFQKREACIESDLPTCILYYEDLFNRVEVTFVDKTNPNDKGFKMELSQRLTYDQFATALAQKVGTDQNYLQFFKCHRYRDSPGLPVSCTFEGTIRDLLELSKHKSKKKIFYQQLTIPVFELENRKPFECIYVFPDMIKTKELILYPNKNGTVADLLKEAKKQIEFDETSTGKLRLVEVCFDEYLIMGPKIDTPLESLPTTKRYRVEQIPSEELVLAEDEMLVTCIQIESPFFIKVKQGETFGKVKERILRKCAVPEKEWKAYTFKTNLPRYPRYWSYWPSDTLVNLNNFKLQKTPESPSDIPCIHFYR